jgi:beta-glucanase (GH16 family)
MLRRVTTALVVVASTALTFVAVPDRVNASDPAGWRRVFSNSFDVANTLPTWCSAYDGAPEGAQASYFRPEAVTVTGGRLHLSLHRRAYAGHRFVTGELRCLGAAQQFGRYEFRARVPVGAGIESVALLRPVDVQAARHGSQLAITAKPGAEQAVVSNGDGNDTTTRTLPGKFSDWHTYVIEWTPSGFRVFVDSQPRSVDAAASTEPRWFGFAVTTGDKAGTPGASTALPAEFQVDYLRIWAFEPVASAPAVAAQPTTAAAAASGPGSGGRNWSLWLAVIAMVASALALFALVVHKTRPHRPPSGHRA